MVVWIRAAGLDGMSWWVVWEGSGGRCVEQGLAASEGEARKMADEVVKRCR